MHKVTIDQREMTNGMLEEVIDAKKATRFMGEKPTTPSTLQRHI